jgi:hypothetical protein
MKDLLNAVELAIETAEAIRADLAKAGKPTAHLSVGVGGLYTAREQFKEHMRLNPDAAAPQNQSSSTSPSRCSDQQF